jgi:hypothetical protein
MTRRPWRVRDLSGQRFGRLVALTIDGHDADNRALWLCACDCGTQKQIPSRHLVSGSVVSCGCHRNERSAENGKSSAGKHSGKLCHLYKPELTDEERLRTRSTPEVLAWRRAVYEASDYTCDTCGKRGVSLVAHHLLSWSAHKKDRFVVKNGVALCRKHHHDLHMSVGGSRRECTPSDYTAFKSRFLSSTNEGQAA